MTVPLETATVFLQRNVVEANSMIRRLYIHNFRCFENFELRLADMPTTLLLGKNGTGKSSIAAALRVLQSIGRGFNRTGQLVQLKDFFLARMQSPMRFEIQVTLGEQTYDYALAFELPEAFKELRVLEEHLLLNGQPVFTRKLAQVSLPKQHDSGEAKFLVDWHLIALPVIQDPSGSHRLGTFREWLASMVILAPIPSLMSGESSAPTLQPNVDGANFADWAAGLLRLHPSTYQTIQHYLESQMPDFSHLKSEVVGRDVTRLLVGFSTKTDRLSLDFAALSDGEKCFLLCAVVLAANDAYGPFFCFWDEPDNFLSLSEVGHFVLALRKGFNRGGQIVVSSHNEETIRKFSPENTWILDRKSHLEPSLIRLLAELSTKRLDVVQMLMTSDQSL